MATRAGNKPPIEEQRWRAMQTIFHHAAQLSGDERPPFIADACGDDEDMQREIEALLSVYDASSEALHAGGAAATVDVEPHIRPRLREGPGTQIGNYRLRDQIGEGGFGVVYRADQREPVRRQVALKILRLGMDSDQVIARFEAERQALALMDHPNIARVFDAGTTDSGRPYFVMELVKGIPITQYCDQHDLTMRDRLELIVQVCHAVQHAHQKGVIHRDIKPTNVLVAVQDDKLIPKVIDFGIAKATSARLTERTYFTEHRQFIGTPEYMSPEQADPSALDIDTRSDVYSLGVLLYELLTGTTPFEPSRLRSAAFNEIQRIIREEEPQKPSTRISSLQQSRLETGSSGVSAGHDEVSQDGDAPADAPDGSLAASSIDEIARHRRSDPSALSRLIRGDLDWIVMKALEKDRTRRYETASALALDIERHLHHEPILASPPSVTYRLRKFARRHTGVLVGVSAVAVALVLGAAVATVGFVRASDQRDRAVLAEGRANEERDAARLAESEAVAQRNQSLAVTEFLADMLAAVDPAEMGRDVSVREVLDKASATVETEFDDRPLVRARLRGTIGQSYMGLGLYDEAEPHLIDAYETFERENGPEHSDSIQSMSNLGALYRLQSRLDEAETILKKALDRSVVVNGEPHPLTCITLTNLAGHYRSVGRYDEARTLNDRGLACNLAVNGEEHNETLTIMNNLGYLNKQVGNYEEAEDLLTRAFEIRTRVNGPEHPHTLLVRHNIANLYASTNRIPESEEIYRDVYEARLQVLGEDHPDTLLTQSEIAFCLNARGEVDEAKRQYREILEKELRLFGEDHLRPLSTRAAMAFIDMQNGRPELAEPQFEAILEAQRRALGPDHPSTLTTMNNLAGSRVNQGNFDDAFPILEEALDVRSRLHGDSHPSTSRLLRNLGGMYRSKERWADALQMYQRRLAVMRERLGDDDPQTDSVEAVTVELLIFTKAFEEAEPMALRVYERRLQMYGIGDERTRGAVALLIKLYDDTNRPDEAATWREKASESLRARDEAAATAGDGGGVS